VSSFSFLDAIEEMHRDALELAAHRIALALAQILSRRGKVLAVEAVIGARAKKSSS
jgi:hypothetical protein